MFYSKFSSKIQTFKLYHHIQTFSSKIETLSMVKITLIDVERDEGGDTSEKIATDDPEVEEVADTSKKIV
ncbi:hypothetical protein TSUD_28800 [Trifolium subterraneum]|uniref:Uncharacterized protein n=1 Tax=Trifolium subterraneum TaxID=3900 RepID=A0A2Z6PUI1_TRISU|nr:hypothetical protein TSUD_28800 [Trifolium subterraneum]